MIRPARMGDVMRLVALLEEKHRQSRYAGIVGLDRAAARRLLAGLIQRNGGKTEGSGIVIVEETGGTVEAFIAGLVDRVYLIGDKLKATDVFLVAGEKASPRAALALVRGYIGWAERNPAIFEIELTHSDVIPGTERVPDVYRSMGFEQFASGFRRANPNHANEERAAA